MEHNVNPGPDPYQNKEEEKELAVFLKMNASMGYSKTRKKVMAIGEIYVKSRLKCDKKKAEKFKNYSRVVYIEIS